MFAGKRLIPVLQERYSVVGCFDDKACRDHPCQMLCTLNTLPIVQLYVVHTGSGPSAYNVFGVQRVYAQDYMYTDMFSNHMHIMEYLLRV